MAFVFLWSVEIGSFGLQVVKICMIFVAEGVVIQSFPAPFVCSSCRVKCSLFVLILRVSAWLLIFYISVVLSLILFFLSLQKYLMWPSYYHDVKQLILAGIVERWSSLKLQFVYLTEGNISSWGFFLTSYYLYPAIFVSFGFSFTIILTNYIVHIICTCMLGHVCCI